MTEKEIQEELNMVQNSSYAKKTDRQLYAIEMLSAIHKEKYMGLQPPSLVVFNDWSTRQNCKLTPEQVKEIRRKYKPYEYGKLRLAKEYGVSTSVIYRIVRNRSWKTIGPSNC